VILRLYPQNFQHAGVIRVYAEHMQLNRRRLLAGAGLLLAGGSGLIAACQGGTSQPTIVVTTAPAAPTAAAAAAPTAVPTPAVVATVPTPAVAPRSTPLPAVVVGKPMYQQDAQHTGRSPTAGPRQQPGLVRRFDTALPQNLPAESVTPRADFQSSSAIGPDGTIYIANFPGALFALRDSPSARDQLEVVWRFHPPTSSSFHATPALSADGSTLYIGFASGGFNQPGSATFYALKAPASGTEPQVLWTVDLGATRVMASPTVGPDGTIYVGDSGGDLFAIGSNGTIKWQTQTGPSVKSAPALAADGTVYHASSNGKMYAVSPQGQVKWTFDFGEHLGSTPLLTSQGGGPGGGGGANGIGSGGSPTVGADGTIFIGANNSNMYAVAADGRMKWLFEAERELAGIWTTPVLSSDGGSLYFGANKGGLYALNADTGTRRWQFPVYGSVYASSVLDARGVLYTGTTIEHVFAVDSATGERIWDYDAHNEVWSAPSIRPDGSLVIADRGGLVQVLA
jgi:outer membrane protein assembly factor BamB